MRYFYEKPSSWLNVGEIYNCDHPMFNRCTLFRDGGRGIIVVQEYFNPIKKARWWSSIEPWIANDIYLNSNFKVFFEQHAEKADADGLYPVFKVRNLMWELRMKPLRKEWWESF